MFAFTIGGVVLEADTRRPLGGWYVEAYDKDRIFDLGSAVTAADGTFAIHTKLRDFRELFERRPDVYFRLARRPGEDFVHATSGGVAFDAERLSRHEIHVPLDAVAPSAAAGGEVRRVRGEGRPG